MRQESCNARVSNADVLDRAQLCELNDDENRGREQRI